MTPPDLPEFFSTLSTRLAGIFAAIFLMLAALRGPPPGASPQLLPDVYLPSTGWDDRQEGSYAQA